MNLSVKEVWKSVNIWRSYGQYCSALFFWLTVYISYYADITKPTVRGCIGPSLITVSRFALVTVSFAGSLRPTDTDSVMLLSDVSVYLSYAYQFNYTYQFLIDTNILYLAGRRRATTDHWATGYSSWIMLGSWHHGWSYTVDVTVPRYTRPVPAHCCTERDD